MAKNQTNNTTNRSTQKTTNRTQQKTTNRTTNTTNTTDSKNASEAGRAVMARVHKVTLPCYRQGAILASPRKTAAA